MAAAEQASLDRIERLLTAILALLAAEREEAGTEISLRRAEAVLADAGLPVSEIAAALGKNKESVKSTVRRSKKGSGKGG